MKNNDKVFHKLRQSLPVKTSEVWMDSGMARAAVLVLLSKINGEVVLLLEVRATHLNWQPGEICCPGGRIEADDINAQATAVRETVEELGVSATAIEVIGALPLLASSMGILISPFVAWLEEGTVLNPDDGEVDEVITVPWRVFMEAEPLICHMEMATRLQTDVPGGWLSETYGYNEWRFRRRYPVLFYRHENHTIWGLTARIINNLVIIARSQEKNKNTYL